MKAVSRASSNTDSGVTLSYFDYSIDSCFFDVYDISVEKTGIAQTDNTFWVNKETYRQMQVDSGVYVLKGVDAQTTDFAVTGIISEIQSMPVFESRGAVAMRILREGERPGFISIRIADNVNMASVVNQINSVYKPFAGDADYKGEFIDAAVQRAYKNEIATSQLLAGFAILTLIITIMGIFAMSLYQVQQKEKEIGIRKVNGATVYQILAMLNVASIKLLIVGFVIASPIAYYAATTWLENFAYKIGISPWVFALSLGIVSILTLISVTIMTWRAARTNPIEVLKGE